MLDFTTPEVTESIGKITYTWDTLDMKIVADRISDAGSAELWFYHQNGDGTSLLHTAKANLLSSSTMTQLGKRMKEHSEDVPWTQVLTYITAHTMEFTRRGEPGVILQPSESKAVHPGYYIEPVIMKGVPSVIYGDKGTNKTTTALVLLGLLATNYTNTGIELYPTGTAKVGILDWECNRQLTEYTLSRLINGKVIPAFSPAYLRGKQSLPDEIERIANFIHDNQVEIVMIDSLGQAAGSDKFDASGKMVALRFFEALRQLNVTSLIIAQNAKGGDDANGKTIFGSTYFTYYARNIFELRGKQDKVDHDTMHIALFHKEANYSKKYPPMGFRLSYTDTAITMSSESVSLSEFIEKASQTKKLLDFLKEGAKSNRSISEEMCISSKHVSVLLNRLQERKLVVNLGSGMWGAAATDIDESNS